MSASRTVAAGLLWQMSTWAKYAACLSSLAQELGDWNQSDYDDATADRLAVVCLGCPVAAPCLELALVFDVRVGIRGGLTPAERDEYLGDSGSLSSSPWLESEDPR